MTILERFRKANISDEDIIRTFEFNTGGYSIKSKRSYSFGDSNNPNSFWAIFHFNSEGDLYEIKLGDLLRSEKAQDEFVEKAKQQIFGEHGYITQHRILYSSKPLKGIFTWRDTFRIRPCLNTTHIGKGLAWDMGNQINQKEPHMGPPFPFILEVKTKRSPNFIIQNHRIYSSLDYHQWLLVLLLPYLIGAPPVTHNTPQWILLKTEKGLEYHLVYEGFNAHESEVEHGDNFSKSNIPYVTKYTGSVEYYNHLWFQDEEIQIPKEFELYIKAFEELSGEKKENFIRSLYWFNTGTRLYNQEELSIIPFTIAVESLLPNPSKEKCPTCHKSLDNGPTKLFKDFLEKNLDLPSDINHLKKSIYPKRSKIVHGTSASAADYGFSSIFNHSNSEMITESFIRRALINWLINGSIEDT
jgi:Apea-like HEPN